MANHRSATSSTDTPYPATGEEARAQQHPSEPPDESFAGWTHRTRIVLSPVAAPSVLGLFGFFAATVMVGTNLAGWWGGQNAGLTIFPFALFLGGLAQLLAGMWS